MLRKLRKFAALDWHDRQIILQAFALVCATRLALWYVPFRQVAKTQALGLNTGVPPDRLAWAITAAANCVPRATCLVRALAAQRLFAFHGYTSELRIGVANSRETGFKAHAWLEHRGVTIIGAAVDVPYTPLATPKREMSFR